MIITTLLLPDSHYFSVDVKVTGNRQFAFQMLVHAKKWYDVECRKHACAMAKSKELL
jgi:hypothetical protein